MAHSYNAFISYAWRDNQPFEAGGQGWVGRFVDRLANHLGRTLPRDCAAGIWLDYEQMRGNADISAEIRAKLAASRLLVPILSKAWLDSPWCRQELQLFLDRHGPDSGRIFPIWMEPVEGLPPPLDALLKYRFWQEDEHKQPRTRCFPGHDPTDREFGRLQQDLARDMAATLQALHAAEGPQTEPAPPPPPTKRNGHKLVLVNGGEEDGELLQRVARHLKDRGIGCALPLHAVPSPRPLRSSEINRDLRDKLALCDAVLLVYRDGPAHQVSQQIVEYLKAVAKPRRGAPPTLDLCQTRPDPLAAGLAPTGMRVHVVEYPCADQCVAHFLGTAP